MGFRSAKTVHSALDEEDEKRFRAGRVLAHEDDVIRELLERNSYQAWFNKWVGMGFMRTFLPQSYPAAPKSRVKAASFSVKTVSKHRVLGDSKHLSKHQYFTAEKTPALAKVAVYSRGVRHSGGRGAWRMKSGGPAPTEAFGARPVTLRLYEAGDAKGTAVRFARYIRRKGAEEAGGDAGYLGSDVCRRKDFWEAVEERETRKDARVQHRIIAALPCELDSLQRRELVQSFGDALAAWGLPWESAIHRPDAHGDERNWHMHAIFHDRPAWLAEDGSIAFASKKADVTRERGFVERLRELWTELVNTALERIGSEVRYEHKSFERQHAEARANDEVADCPREATRHLGVRQAARERMGYVTPVGAHNAGVLTRRWHDELKRDLNEERDLLSSSIRDEVGGLQLRIELADELPASKRWKERLSAAVDTAEDEIARMMAARERAAIFELMARNGVTRLRTYSKQAVKERRAQYMERLEKGIEPRPECWRRGTNADPEEAGEIADLLVQYYRQKSARADALVESAEARLLQTAKVISDMKREIGAEAGVELLRMSREDLDQAQNERANDRRISMAEWVQESDSRVSRIAALDKALQTRLSDVLATILPRVPDDQYEAVRRLTTSAAGLEELADACRARIDSETPGPGATDATYKELASLAAMRRARDDVAGRQAQATRIAEDPKKLVKYVRTEADVARQDGRIAAAKQALAQAVSYAMIDPSTVAAAKREGLAELLRAVREDLDQAEAERVADDRSSQVERARKRRNAYARAGKMVASDAQQVIALLTASDTYLDEEEQDELRVRPASTERLQKIVSIWHERVAADEAESDAAQAIAKELANIVDLRRNLASCVEDLTESEGIETSPEERAEMVRFKADKRRSDHRAETAARQLNGAERMVTPWAPALASAGKEGLLDTVTESTHEAYPRRTLETAVPQLERRHSDPGASSSAGQLPAGLTSGFVTDVEEPEPAAVQLFERLNRSHRSVVEAVELAIRWPRAAASALARHELLRVKLEIGLREAQDEHCDLFGEPAAVLERSDVDAQALRALSANVHRSSESGLIRKYADYAYLLSSELERLAAMVEGRDEAAGALSRLPDSFQSFATQYDDALREVRAHPGALRLATALGLLQPVEDLELLTEPFARLPGLIHKYEVVAGLTRCTEGDWRDRCAVVLLGPDLVGGAFLQRVNSFADAANVARPATCADEFELIGALTAWFAVHRPLFSHAQLGDELHLTASKLQSEADEYAHKLMRELILGRTAADPRFRATLVWTEDDIEEHRRAHSDAKHALAREMARLASDPILYDNLLADGLLTFEPRRPGGVTDVLSAFRAEDVAWKIAMRERPEYQPSRLHNYNRGKWIPPHERWAKDVSHDQRAPDVQRETNMRVGSRAAKKGLSSLPKRREQSPTQSRPISPDTEHILEGVRRAADKKMAAAAAAAAALPMTQRVEFGEQIPEPGETHILHLQEYKQGSAGEPSGQACHMSEVVMDDRDTSVIAAESGGLPDGPTAFPLDDRHLTVVALPPELAKPEHSGRAADAAAEVKPLFNKRRSRGNSLDD